MFIYNREHMVELINWIAELPTRESYFLQNSFKDTQLKADKYSIFLVKLALFASGNAFLALTVGMLGFKLLVLRKSFPLFIDVHLLFLAPNNLPIYLINLLHQLYAIVVIVSILSYAACFLLTFLIHVLVYLDAISVLVRNMDEGIKAESLEKWIRAVSIEVKHLKM